MITITLYKEDQDSLVAERTFTSELSTASNNWKAFAKKKMVLMKIYKLYNQMILC